MLTREAIIFYAVVHTALISCLLVLAGMGVKRLLKEGLKWKSRANRPGSSCWRTTAAR